MPVCVNPLLALRVVIAQDNFVNMLLEWSIRPWTVWPMLVLLCGLFAGCDQVESRYVYSPETAELMPAAREAVQASLEATFGTPADPRIPFFFPVDRGGDLWTVQDVDAENRSQLTLEEKGLPPISTPAKLEFLFDPEAVFEVRMDALESGSPDPLASLGTLMATAFDPKSAVLSLSGPLPEMELIEPGLKLAFHPNANLRRARELYGQHCLHCHGVTGDGNGPTAAFMQPRPRDYRLGIFKYTSTGPQEKISTADLKHILKEGIPGTYMPSFNMLPETQLDLMVSYVKYLALRGETEKKLNVELAVDFSQKVLDKDLADVEDPAEQQEIQREFEQDLTEFLSEDYPEIELGVLQDLADNWSHADAEDAILWPSLGRPDPRGPSLANPELTSVENGRQLYLGKDAQCASCHGDTGRGNGYQTFQFQKKRDGSLYDTVGLHDEWGNPLPPRDLTTGIFRGGSRPVDLFRRLYVGIKGTPMPVFGGKGLTDAQIWDIVNYLMVLSEESR